MRVVNAEFIKSAASRSGYPDEGLPEVAFGGRSNVGKSSLINKLLNRKRLARVSGKPGHTRLLNFYRVNGRVVFTDLPGYGFARVSAKERESWKRMVEEYLLTRDELKAVVLIMDIRRTPGAEEEELIGFLTANGIAPILAVTKADKLGKTKRTKPLRELASRLGISPGQVAVFSAHTGEGREELWKKILAAAEQD